MSADTAQPPPSLQGKKPAAGKCDISWARFKSCNELYSFANRGKLEFDYSIDFSFCPFCGTRIDNAEASDAE